MSTPDEILQFIENVTQDDRYFSVLLNVGGKPPTIQQVANCYYSIWSDIDFSYLLASALHCVDNEESETSKEVSELLALLRKQSEGGGPFDHRLLNRFRHVNWPRTTALPLPSVRVLGSEHQNPLETLILVSAASSVMLITSVMWGLRTYRNSQGKRLIQEEIAKLAAKVAIVIARGNPNAIESLTPIALALVAAGFASADENENVDIRVAPVTSLSIGKRK